MLAEGVDAVIGIDTHRDSHEVEIAAQARYGYLERASAHALGCTGLNTSKHAPVFASRCSAVLL